MKTQTGAWIQDRASIGAGLSVEPGLRVDWNSLTDETAVQPRLRLAKTIGRGSIWAGIAWQAQTPGHETMQQGNQYYDLTGPEQSALRNERSRQVVFGAEYPISRSMTVRVEAYRRTFDRLLQQRQENQGEYQRRLARYEIPPDMPPDDALLEDRPTIDPESTGTGRGAGLELLLQRTHGRVFGWVSYVWSKSERELYGHTVPFDFDRPHAAAIAVNVQVVSRVRVSAMSQYASGFPIAPLHPEVQFSQVPSPPLGLLKPLRDGDSDLIARRYPDNLVRLGLANSSRLPAGRPHRRARHRDHHEMARGVRRNPESVQSLELPRQRAHRRRAGIRRRLPGRAEFSPAAELWCPNHVLGSAASTSNVPGSGLRDRSSDRHLSTSKTGDHEIRSKPKWFFS